jgi:hypothetical protein
LAAKNLKWPSVHFSRQGPAMPLKAMPDLRVKINQ